MPPSWIDFDKSTTSITTDRGVNMDHNQDDKTTTKYMIITFVGFAVLCVLLIIGANVIG